MPEISVIIPVYNVEKYLIRCIESVLRQTYTDFEILLVNDGSSDHSKVICEQYAKMNQCIHVISQDNKGVSSARNLGLKNAKGMYVTFIDSDDEVEENYLASMLEKKSEADLVVCGVKHINSNGVLWNTTNCSSRIDYKINTSSVLYMLKNKLGDSVCSKRYKRSIIERNSIYFDENMNIGEDSYFNAQYVCNCETIEFLEKTPYIYHKYNHKTLSGYDKDYVQRMENVNEKIGNVLSKRYNDITQELVWKQRCFSVYYYAIFLILRSKEHKVVEKYHMLKSVLSMEKLRPYLKELDTYMNEDTKIIQKIIGTRCPLFILLFWKVLNLKRFIVQQYR